MRIPSWSEAEYNIKNGDGTALDEFIYWHEPEGTLEEHDFRQDLQELITFLLNYQEDSEHPLCSRCGEKVIYEGNLCWDCMDG